MIPVLFASFALPLVAAGAAVGAAALPLLIHLLSQQKYQVVPWAAVRFLATAQKRHRKRIDRWLLLVLRMLALLIPLLGVCASTDWAEKIWQSLRPGQMESASNAPRTHHVLVLDGSLSMTAATERGTRFEKAVSQIETLVRTSNPGDGFTLIFAAGTSQAIVPGPANDTEKVLLELRNLKATHGACDFPSALTLVADTLARSPRNYPRRQVTVFTDLQRSAWNPALPKADSPPPEYYARIFSKADFAVIDAAGADYDNLSVVDISLADPLVLVDTPTAILASVHNYGKSDKKAVRVELSVGRPSNSDAPPVLIESRTIDTIGSGQRASVAFVLDGANRFREAGSHLIQIRLADADDLPADDVRALAFEVRESLPCLLVNGKPSRDPIARASEYLQTALEPAKGKLPYTNPARPKTIGLSEFADAEFADLSNSDCVFLCDVPSLTAAQVSRLETHLKRGGGVIIGLGPNAAANIAKYNELLFNNGNGLLPGKLIDVKKQTGPDDLGFRVAGDERAFAAEPLAAFRSDNARAGLASVPFKQYLRMEAPADGRARRILSFAPAKPVELKPGEVGTKPDPAIVEMPRHRGRVIVYTSSFNQDWTDWPVLPSYLPMMHELLRYAVTSPDRHTVAVGETLEEFFPATAVGSKATITGPEALSGDVTIVAGEELGIARYPDPQIAGLYRLALPGKKPSLFAVNVPETAPGGGSESDLLRLDLQVLKDLNPTIAVAADPSDLKFLTSEAGPSVFSPRPWGPTLARWLLTMTLVVWLVELFYAWWIGPSRAAVSTGKADPPPGGSTLSKWFWNGIALIPLAAALLLAFAVAHHAATGQLLGFLPEAWRSGIETALGVPGAGPGEGTRWRLESFGVYLKTYANDSLALFIVIALAMAGVLALYWMERKASGRIRAVILPAFLRLAAVWILGAVLLPQLRLAFDREGWPDIAVLLDTSASMATVEELQDPAVKAKARELMMADGSSEADRLKLAKALLTRKDGDWLNRLLTKRQIKVHLYSMADQTKLIAEMSEPGDLNAGREAVAKLVADGESSRLGDGIEAVLKAFRGGSLSGIIAFTDGVVTSGDDLAKAGREAARSNVPLYLVGLGETAEPLDLVMSDLRADDVVIKADKWLLEARLTAKGPNPPATVPVILSERQGEKLIERARQVVSLDPSGKPVPIKLAHTPMEVGLKTFVIEVPAQPGEVETLNNKIERTVLVTDSKRLKVLYMDGQPRYEFRFVKSLLERETEEARGNRAVEIDVLLWDSSASHWQTDKSAERLRGAIPTKTQLFEYDVVIFGDVNPNQIPKANPFFADLAEFVKVRGGGLLFVAGEGATPHKLFDTPLGELLPVAPTESSVKTGGPPPTPLETPLTEAYLPKPTPLGRTHPLFRFVADDADNIRIWENLRPFYWSSGGYKRKPAAEVLAVHPTKPGEGPDSGGNHPLVLQHFVGTGRVVFFAFDETWRWRYRSGEEYFNHFWTQAVRATARSRVTRIEVRTDKQTAYRRGEPIRITVRYPDDAPAPANEQAVKVQVARKPIRLPGRGGVVGDTENQTVTLSKVDGTRATYETLLTRTPDGEYLFTLTEGDIGKSPNKPRAEARVLPPPGERDRLEMNRTELIRAATESRGKFYTLAEADTLVEDLPDAERVPLNQPCPPFSIWNHAVLYGLIASLLGCEWWLRRRGRMV